MQAVADPMSVILAETRQYKTTTTKITTAKIVTHDNELCKTIRGLRLFVSVFTALHKMQTRSCDENSVCPSVKRVHCDKTEEKICRDFYTMRKII